MSAIPAYRFNALILDMDGVLWKDSEPIGNLAKIFGKLIASGIKFAFVTNNATRTVKHYLDRLHGYGIPVEDHLVINSGLGTAIYLSTHYPHRAKVFVIGEEGLITTLSEFGFKHNENDPVAVIVGLDRTLTYEKLRKAAMFIKTGLEFIGTNPDPTLPTPDGFIPGTGAILAALETATNRKPFIIGKPYPLLFKFALQRLGEPADKTLVVGDRLMTDIAGGIAANCPTGLVFSGVTHKDDLENSTFQPTIVAEDLGTLVDLIT